MLWFGIVSLIMAFAGWTSAYIVSSKRKDWLETIELPQAFFISTAIILFSSLTYILAKKAVKKNSQKMATRWLLTTLGLGMVFIVLQFYGFSQMLGSGYYFTGPTSNIKMSYIFFDCLCAHSSCSRRIDFFIGSAVQTNKGQIHTK